MNLACLSVVEIGGKIVGIRCAKKRGIILPGGKWNPGETFKETAARELQEETGLLAIHQELILGFMSTDLNYVYAFETQVLEWKPKSSAEGTVGLFTWTQLCKSKYGPCYELLIEKRKKF